MKIKFVAFIVTILVSTNAQAVDEFDDASAFENNAPSSNKLAPPRDFDNLYSIPLSSRERLSVGGDVNFEPDLDEPQEAQARFSVNYSMTF